MRSVGGQGWTPYNAPGIHALSGYNRPVRSVGWLFRLDQGDEFGLVTESAFGVLRDGARVASFVARSQPGLPQIQSACQFGVVIRRLHVELSWADKENRGGLSISL